VPKQWEPEVVGRILVADDLAANRILLRARLSNARYQVAFAEPRAALLAAAAAEAPDVALIDLGAPLAEALGLIRAWRADPVTARIPLVALSFADGPDLRRAALEAGADEVLARSCDDALLFARIRSLARARHEEEELDLRDETRAALGFAEPAAPFEHAGSVALVAGRAAAAEAWRATLAPHLRDRVEPLAPDLLLGGPGRPFAHDVYVIAADLAGRHDGLRLIPELRSRAGGRSAGIVAVVDPDDTQAAVAALDLGANDVVAAGADGIEMVLRVRTQLRRKARADRMRRQVSDGLRLALTDPLTGLLNRRAALARLGQIAQRALETGQAFAVMVLDLDLFKRVNDQHGHAAGDEVLIEVARRIADTLRAEDLVARLGGEEFLVAMPDAGAEAAAAAAERLRRVIEARPFALPAGAGALDLTVSIGVALGAGAESAAPEILVGRADSALYAAKAEGRNQVTIGRTAA
jgi:two-component system cell cycle response regulator